MQVYLNEKPEFGTMGLWEMKKQNKYGVMYGISPKVDLVTTDYIGDYHVYHSPNGKVYLCINGDGQVGKALKNIEESVTKEKGFVFKPTKKTLYIRIPNGMEVGIPKHSNLLISVNVYGVFLQQATNLAFVQFELSAFNATPRIDFNPKVVDDNAVFP